MNENAEGYFSTFDILNSALKEHLAILDSCVVPDGVKPFNIPVEKQYVARDAFHYLQAVSMLLEMTIREARTVEKPRTLWQKLFRK